MTADEKKYWEDRLGDKNWHATMSGQGAQIGYLYTEYLREEARAQAAEAEVHSLREATAHQEKRIRDLQALLANPTHPAGHVKKARKEA